MAEAARPSVGLATVAWPLRTERLLIRRARAEDAEASWEVRRHPEAGEWVSRAATDHAAYVAGHGQPDRLDHMLVVELVRSEENLLVGDLMLKLQDPWAQAEVAEHALGVQAEVGWVIHRDHAGQGYATEAAAELLRVCFEDLGLRRVVAECFADNVPSWRVMERLGMRREAHFVRDALHRSGRWLDSYAYAILAEEWRAGRGGTLAG